jgi:hypothetical protein
MDAWSFVPIFPSGIYGYSIKDMSCLPKSYNKHVSGGKLRFTFIPSKCNTQ